MCFVLWGTPPPNPPPPKKKRGKGVPFWLPYCSLSRSQILLSQKDTLTTVRFSKQENPPKPLVSLGFPTFSIWFPFGFLLKQPKKAPSKSSPMRGTRKLAAAPAWQSSSGTRSQGHLLLRREIERERPRQL